jgi:hypothetical protein
MYGTYQRLGSRIVCEDELTLHLVQEQEHPLLPLPGLWKNHCHREMMHIEGTIQGPSRGSPCYPPPPPPQQIPR